jgi:serpin B
MRKFMLALLVMAAPLAALASPLGLTESAQAVALGSNLLGVDLASQLAASPQANVFLSPFSISTALAMTYAGARGETAAQMAKALHFGLGQEQLHAGFAGLLSATSDAGKPYQLKAANALWGQKGFHFQEAYLGLVASHYQGGLQSVDFGDDADGRQRINAWVEDHTAHKIVELLHKRDVDGSTRLVLTNAIYFKSAWGFKVDPARTRVGPFHCASGEISQASMMHWQGRFGYAESAAYQALELPYAGNELCLLVVLPKPGASLSQGLAELLQDARGLPEEEVDVALPKLKFEARADLASLLSGLGMPLAFSKAADFSGITGDQSLCISKVIHQAKIEVNEEGSEAAAATAVVMVMKAVARRPRLAEFKADHPFLFAIIHKPSSALLFLGRVADPAQ